MIVSCYISRVCIYFPLIIVILLIRFRLFDLMLIRTCDNGNKKNLRENVYAGPPHNGIGVVNSIHSFIHAYWLFHFVYLSITI